MTHVRNSIQKFVRRRKHLLFDFCLAGRRKAFVHWLFSLPSQAESPVKPENPDLFL